MRYVSRVPNKSEQDSTEKTNHGVSGQRRTALLTRCEARGREVYTAGGQYLGLAENAERAAAWAKVGELLSLAKRVADGKAPTQAEAAALVSQILKAG